MDVHIGLSPEEMVSVFNQMYLNVWESNKNNINWEMAKVAKRIKEDEDADISRLLLEFLEVVITAARDGFVMTLYENNERIFNDLLAVQSQISEESEDSGGIES